MQHSWVNLAPLIQTPFTDCKSAIKVIEAAYWGIPTICSDNHDMRRFIDSGALIAKDEHDVQDHLNKLLDNDYYNKYTDCLRDKVLSKANVFYSAKIMLKLIKATKL